MADETKSHGNLDFSAPLLSARRAAHLSSEDSNLNHHRGVLVRDISKRVPFSWERAPGMPKDNVRSDKHVALDLPPPPKLPPARWRPTPKEETDDSDNDGDEDDDEDDDEDEDDDVFSDAMDMFFLSESLDVGDFDMSRFDLEIIDARGDRSPGFIIRRVLPTSNAVASCSSSNPPVRSAASRNSNRRVRCSKGLNNTHCVHRSVAESYTSPKACGLTSFFPWRMKPMICGLKSPIRPGSRQSQTSAGCFN
ncbi:hypothetical protein NE237_010654 [Protea cynaroides]|uniref:Uncharacterized protein n=1 Tax=Protea cynaroides TaxID=273540 RepID=A0A9Q0R1S3_9MAGN|nr:hypothetical protein NE237_010654 [Protea cynaroides]